MKRFFLIFLVGMFFSLAASADDGEPSADQILARYQVEHSSRRMAESAFRQLSQITAVLDAVAGLLNEDGGDLNDIHRTLGWMIDGLPALRAVIVVGSDGRLLHDSATMPAPKLELGDRAYFINAPDRTHERPFIGTPIIGRSSALPFLAVSRRLDNGSVAVAMVNPDSLIPPHFRCATCSAAILSESGEVLASIPYGYSPPAEVTDQIQTGAGSGVKSFTSGQLPALLAFSDVERFGLTAVLTVLSK